MILPTGSGKTAVGLWTLESVLAVAPERAALVCTPTLPLVDQTLDAYRRESAAMRDGRTRLLVVASKCASTDVQTTTEPREIARFLAPARRAGAAPALVPPPPISPDVCQFAAGCSERVCGPKLMKPACSVPTRFGLCSSREAFASSCSWRV